MSAAPGDPVYRNPVLDADWSDPDVIRVGDDFYLTASSFGRVPGLPLLHSRDLVNWTLVGHALQRLEPESEFTVPRHDCGVWAPSLRHHDGRFWIFWGDPDQGVFQVNAPEIRGPWTRPHLVKAGKGLIDPCPLWDDETGEAYLVHAWAKSRSGIKNRLTGHRMHPHGTELLDEGKVIVDGDRIPGWFTLEGPKLYKHDGWFWILAPAGGVETGWQGAFRSRAFFGPYEEKVVLEQKDTDVNGPHQGGWVRTPSGEDWFLHFQQRGPYGRVVHLQPMRWGGGGTSRSWGSPRSSGVGSGGEAESGGGWPVIGDDGAPVTVHRRPDLPPQPPAAPATDDDFPGGRPGRQWQWTANPRDGWATHHSADGLRLTCVRTPDAHDLRALPNVLTQRLPGTPCTVEVDLRLDDGEPGARAGLAVLGDAYSWIGLRRGTDGTVHLVHRFAETAAEQERDAAPPRPAPDGRARLRVDIDAGARCRFSYDTGDGAGDDAGDGAEGGTGGGGFRPSGQVFAATPWRWVGALLGLVALAPTGQGHAGTATFTQFRIRIQEKRADR
ncbi:glycoside hydrolase 43 family protein [Streptomyces sp. RO-S4]|uniref:glycoside hydrolase family 43 protein n=1 Tax=Streptomyces sp. RO-S4 TaxID=2902486 RepID=UPI00208FDF3D|nr:glycoside hydrolase 43 family protein [Streptomyces sp. RO-S4]MCO4694875.1 glycoside hydrolase 43 family protein [Streptomyces sp. RO-S4]